MSDKLADMRFIRFLLYEVNKIEELLQYPYHEDHSRETFDMAIDAAYDVAHEVFWPAFQEMDREGVTFDGKNVAAPKAMREIWRQCKEGGWFAPNVCYDLGGQQFPLSIFAVTSFLFNVGNSSAAMYVSGAWGAAHLIESFGSEDLKARYLQPLYGGEWGGTMALTEPDAGTSLGDITTTAVKASEGDHYLIRGTKRFISSGDHDLADNIIHPVLARLEDAPPGVKGISLVVVPKRRVNPDGSLGEFNNVVTAGIEHKMGLRGQATATLMFGEQGECHGWLIGEPNKGLSYMFQLMNHARVFTGIQAVAGASAAYHCAAQYARERLQGREITNRDPLSPQIPIISHADVRRMLLQQKAFIEGALGMILFCAKVADRLQNTTDEEEKKNCNLLLETLTPC
ncbi:MAG TPA: acyl-CoA dehydrogenase, partial [Candidatus Hydrogenedentes bacterium]|nr:acyl-CoA dehydrogenase [Candidatus Hydrogenedentota bacterium]